LRQIDSLALHCNETSPPLRAQASFYIIKPSERVRASHILFFVLLTHAAPSIAFEGAASMQSQNEVPLSAPCKLRVNPAHCVSPSRRSIILQRRYHRVHLEVYAPPSRTLHPPGAPRCTMPASPRGVLHVPLIASFPHQRILRYAQRSLRCLRGTPQCPSLFSSARSARSPRHPTQRSTSVNR
jgi:hypothetical protein